jgi:hypothetical protein
VDLVSREMKVSDVFESLSYYLSLSLSLSSLVLQYMYCSIMGYTVICGSRREEYMFIAKLKGLNEG